MTHNPKPTDTQMKLARGCAAEVHHNRGEGFTAWGMATAAFDDDPAVQSALLAIQATEARIASKIDSLFDAIKHGDDDHKAWLKQALTDHFQREPVDAEARMAQAVEAEREELAILRATVARIREAINYVEPVSIMVKDDIANSLRAGMSLRQVARKYGVGVGVVRGVAAALRALAKGDE